jgi:hypothetical protein
MKKYLFILILAAFSVNSQENEKTVTELNNYADSVDVLIKNSTGGPGELMVSTVNISRNERAIGMQNTKISYFYNQKEDSAYEIDGVMQFMPRYDAPLAVLVEYNIASSQTVVVYYYIQGNNLLYRFISTGGYGYTNSVYWIKNQELIRYEERNSLVGSKHVVQEEKFSKEVYSNGLLVMDHLSDYLKLYYDMFKVSGLDK